MSTSEPYSVAFVVCQDRRNPTRSGNTPPFNTNLPLPSSTSARPAPPNVTSSNFGARSLRAQLPTLTVAQARDEWEGVEAQCLDVTAREGCHVAATREGMGLALSSLPQTVTVTAQNADQLTTETPAYNISISGGHSAVMSARGAMLREGPREHRTTLRIPNTDVLASPAADHTQVKADVLSRLEAISNMSRARLTLTSLPTSGSTNATAVVYADIRPQDEHTSASTDGADQTTQAPGHDRTGSGSSSLGSAHGPSIGAKQAPNVDSGSTTNGHSVGDHGKPSAAPAVPPSYGLETEKQCELIMSGSMESVELAKLRALVLFDELSGLHSEFCEVDYKLQPIIAGRLRVEIQKIQEETATNIYMPTQLVGVFDAPLPGSQQAIGYRHLALPNPVPAPLSMQPTGQSMFSGNMSMYGHGPGMGMGGMGPGMGLTPHMTGQSTMSNMTHGSFRPPPFQSHGMPGDQHFIVRHPDQPRQFDHHQGFDPTPQQFSQNHGFNQPNYPFVQQQSSPGGPMHPRGMPYNGNGYGNGHGHLSSPEDHGLLFAPPMNGMRHPPHQSHHQQYQHQGPLQMNHTGMSSMNSFQSSRMSSPMPHSHGASPMPQLMHMQNSGAGFEPPHQRGMGMHGPPQNFYAGQTHLHVGVYNGMPPYMPDPAARRVGRERYDQPVMDMNRFAGPHPGLHNHTGEHGKLGKANQIWITGDFFNVQRARDMLLQLAAQKVDLLISRDAAIVPRKLDWLLTERLDDLRTIANDNGTYLQVPSVGSQQSVITVFGDHRTGIERTIRAVMALVSQMFFASIWLLPLSFEALLPQTNLHPATMRTYLKQVAQATGAEVVFKANCFEVHGLELQVRAATLMILELDLMQNYRPEVRFRVELGNEYREFISGKKNGKLNKIMKMCGVKIKFETYNDFNFLLDMTGNSEGALQGLSMLLEEMPAELSFHLPETYHKRIIGVAGRNVQRIMKTYGVYIKFSNAEEHASIGGYAENDDNVIGRTPAKNHHNLDIMRQHVINLVIGNDKDFTRETIAIPYRYHRTLLGEKHIFLHDIEKKTNSIIRFPYRETASDLVTIFGPEAQTVVATNMILEHVPFEADLQVPPNPELTRLVTSPEFIGFTEMVKADHQIAISPSANFGQGDEAIFKFRCQQSNTDYLSAAREVLETWLKEHNIQVYPHDAKKRVDNYANAFSHFDSKLLAGGQRAAHGDEQLHRQRTTVDSTNVKALFEGPAEINPGFAGPLGLPTTSRATDVWQPSHARSETTDSVKRDLDPHVSERVRSVTTQHTGHTPRGQSARTQSLDISSLNFSRSLSGGANHFAPIPSSPNGLVSSPNTATGPFFQSSGAGTTTAGLGSPFTVDSLTDGLSNIQVSHPTP